MINYYVQQGFSQLSVTLLYGELKLIHLFKKLSRDACKAICLTSNEVA